MCPKAEAFALSILRDAEASFWDKAEAESYPSSAFSTLIIISGS